jgi:hypothetical protein
MGRLTPITARGSLTGTSTTSCCQQACNILGGQPCHSLARSPLEWMSIKSPAQSPMLPTNTARRSSPSARWASAVRYRQAHPAAAVAEQAARLRLRSWPLWLLALSVPDEERLYLLGRRPFLDSPKDGRSGQNRSAGRHATGAAAARQPYEDRPYPCAACPHCRRLGLPVSSQGAPVSRSVALVPGRNARTLLHV